MRQKPSLYQFLIQILIYLKAPRAIQVLGIPWEFASLVYDNQTKDILFLDWQINELIILV